MYYFERVRFYVPIFWKENGLPFFVDNQWISKRSVVWWMPTNWLAILILILVLPVALLSDWWRGVGIFGGSD